MSDISDGFVMHFKGGSYVCRPERINDFEDCLRRHFDVRRKLVKSLFALDGRPVDAACGPSSVLCGVQLTELNLAMKFAQVDGFLVPALGDAGLTLTLKWPVPTNMVLRFACECVASGRGWSMGECFLFARKVNMPGFWRLPLPNVYQDGRVCMGDQVKGTIHGGAVAECFKSALNSFGTTSWNTDLSPDPARVRALFRWDAARVAVPPPQDWEKLCPAVSRNEMEELCPA